MKIHQYPYDLTVTDYADPSAWPLLSGQLHWRPANANADPTVTPEIGSPSLGHTHMEVWAPIYGELTGNITVPFRIIMFQVAGVVLATESPIGQLITNVVWDTPGAPPMLRGNPTGVVTFSGHLTIDLSKGDPTPDMRNYVPKHGWFTVTFSAHTYFDNGDQTRVYLQVPFYSMLDPMQPERPTDGQSRSLVAHGEVGSARDTFIGAFGDNFVQYNDYLPILAPINALIPQPAPQLYGYGSAVALPPATAMTRFDMDLHNEDDGTLIQSILVPPGVNGNLPSPFDPAILGQGVHKVAAMWQVDSRLGFDNGSVKVTPNEQLAVLLVVSATVGVAPPPPPPPPPPVWTTLPGIFQQDNSVPPKFRFCDAMGMNCQVFVKP